MRALCETFPAHVAAVLGNHDLFALLDAVLAEGARPADGRPHGRNSVYAFSHPEAFAAAGWSPPRADDAELLAAILDAHQVGSIPPPHRFPGRIYTPPLPHERAPSKEAGLIYKRERARRGGNEWCV